MVDKWRNTQQSESAIAGSKGCDSTPLEGSDSTDGKGYDSTPSIYITKYTERNTHIPCGKNGTGSDRKNSSSTPHRGYVQTSFGMKCATILFEVSRKTEPRVRETSLHSWAKEFEELAEWVVDNEQLDRPSAEKSILSELQYHLRYLGKDLRQPHAFSGESFRRKYGAIKRMRQLRGLQREQNSRNDQSGYSSGEYLSDDEIC